MARKNIRWQTYEHPIMGFDVTATALAAAGIDLDESIDGKDLVPHLDGSMRCPINSFSGERDPNMRPASGLKLVKPRGEPEMLFNLSEDIGDNDLSQSHPKSSG